MLDVVATPELLDQLFSVVTGPAGAEGAEGAGAAPSDRLAGYFEKVTPPISPH